MPTMILVVVMIMMMTMKNGTDEEEDEEEAKEKEGDNDRADGYEEVGGEDAFLSGSQAFNWTYLFICLELDFSLCLPCKFNSSMRILRMYPRL